MKKNLSNNNKLEILVKVYSNIKNRIIIYTLFFSVFVVSIFSIQCASNNETKSTNPISSDGGVVCKIGEKIENGKCVQIKVIVGGLDITNLSYTTWLTNQVVTLSHVTVVLTGISIQSLSCFATGLDQGGARLTWTSTGASTCSLSGFAPYTTGIKTYNISAIALITLEDGSKSWQTASASVSIEVFYIKNCASLVKGTGTCGACMLGSTSNKNNDLNKCVVPIFTTWATLPSNFGNFKSININKLGDIYLGSNIAKISKLSTTTIYSYTVFTGSGGYPNAINFDMNGNPFILFQSTYNVESGSISSISQAGNEYNIANIGFGPRGFAFDSSGNNIYLINDKIILFSNVLVKFNLATKTFTDVGMNIKGPVAIKAGMNDKIYFIADDIDSGHTNLFSYDPNAVNKQLLIADVGSSNDYSLAIDAQGNLYTAIAQKNNVLKTTQAGMSSILGNTGTYPLNIVVDQTGNVYTVNLNSKNITKITPSGMSSTFATFTQISRVNDEIKGLAIDANNDLYTFNNRTKELIKISIPLD